MIRATGTLRPRPQGSEPAKKRTLVRYTNETLRNFLAKKTKLRSRAARSRSPSWTFLV
jgi:hypothetical protein